MGTILYYLMLFFPLAVIAMVAWVARYKRKIDK